MSLYGTMLKASRWRSKKYIDFVKSLPCCMCDAPAPSAPHHMKGIGHLSGGGLKAPDSYAMPLCGACHHKMHMQPELWPLQWEYVARTTADAIERGIR